MKLSQLFAGLPGQVARLTGSAADIEVQGICVDSRQLAKDFVFVAIRGEKLDGHDFLSQAFAKGATAVVVEKAIQAPSDFRGQVIQVQSGRKALDYLAARYFGEPSQKLFCVGVTGTNGKTTSTHMIESVLNGGGLATGVIGTINHHLGSHIWATEHTTPDPLQLQARLRDFVDLKAKALAIEVTSHALKQNRVDSIAFDSVVFTNLTRDHLDYHHTMEDYFVTKERLFSEHLERSGKPELTAIVNNDDAHGRRLQFAPRARVWSYGMAQADFRFKVLEQDFSHSLFHLKSPFGECEIRLPMPGLFNVYNAAASIAVGLSAKLSLEQCQQALESFAGVAGRLQAVANKKGFSVFIDYAHTDDALRSSLTTLVNIRAQLKSQSRIITVFGCGGDRDVGKRPLMMQAALQGSDLVIVTSDNPRTEDPEKILRDILHDVPPAKLQKSVFPEVDRRRAIEFAVQMAQQGDVILIAGKGHEDYQIIGTSKIHFSDLEVVQELVQ